MQVTLRSLLIALGIIGFLLIVLGVLSYHKPEYGCFPDTTSKLEWKDKVVLFQWGGFRVYGYPLVKDCPEENRYKYDEMKNSVDM